jgi:hypothetical protein
MNVSVNSAQGPGLYALLTVHKIGINHEQDACIDPNKSGLTIQTTFSPLNHIKSYKFSVQGLSEQCWTSLHDDTCSLQCRNLGVSTSLSAADNST